MNLCVQCHRELSSNLATLMDKFAVDPIKVCGFPNCPNFALIAFGTEQLDKMEWLKKPPYNEKKECRYNNFVSGGTAYGTPHCEEKKKV